MSDVVIINKKQYVKTNCPKCKSEPINRVEYVPMYFNWCKNYNEEYNEIKQMIEESYSSIEEYRDKFLKLTGKKYYRGLH
jgi:thiol-disulfide isomerase/thioredoxin